MARQIDVTERPEIPWLSVVFGYGPMLPFVAGAAAAFATGGALHALVVSLTVVYAASILAFLAGVRRGLSFRTEGGPRVAQIATMLALYLLAFVALVAESLGASRVAIGAVLIGFAAVCVLDPLAAKHGTAPLFFVRLRPTQMPIAVLGLAVLLAVAWAGG